MSSQSLITVYIKYPEMKHGHFDRRQKSNFISGDKILCRHYPEMKSFENKHLRMRVFHQNKRAIQIVAVAFELQSKVFCASGIYIYYCFQLKLKTKLYIIEDKSAINEKSMKYDNFIKNILNIEVKLSRNLFT